jgi:hypothetical protein
MNEFKKVVALKKYSVVIPKLFNLIINMNHAQRARFLEKAEELFSKERAFINENLTDAGKVRHI